jgi:hypothetical protein
MPLGNRGVFSTPGSSERAGNIRRRKEKEMRYEFERDGATVASVLWEGPGQVSVESAEPSVRSTVDRYLSSEVIYLGSGFDFGDDHRDDVLQMRRRDWTPWEFERACRNLAQRLSCTVRRVQTGPVELREEEAFTP